jgi:hypothetical protein
MRACKTNNRTYFPLSVAGSRKDEDHLRAVAADHASPNMILAKPDSRFRDLAEDLLKMEMKNVYYYVAPKKATPSMTPKLPKLVFLHR